MSADRMSAGTVLQESEEPSKLLHIIIPENSRSFVDKLNSIIEEDTGVILDHQNLASGLFPASAIDRRENEGHYGDAWIRDTSAVVKGLLYVRQFSADSSEREKLGQATMRSIGGILNIARQKRWQEAFSQKISDGDEGLYTYLTQEAPPIHIKLDGEVCDWPRQNQPDSWGSLLIVIGHAHEQGIFEPDDEQRKTIINIATYLTHIKAEKFESSSMWEDREVRNPPPISTALIVEEGLKRIRKMFVRDVRSPSEKELVHKMDRGIHAIDVRVEDIYPTDYTWIDGHASKTDLATLVAFGYGDYGRLSLSQYMIAANKQLGNGDLPGKIRFKGDPYYYNGVRNYKGPRDDSREAVWFMALPLESIVFLRRSLRAGIAGNMAEAVSFRNMGLARLQKAMTIGEEYGFYPELFTRENGHFEPNGNDLLWNRALMVDAAVMAREALKF